MKTLIQIQHSDCHINSNFLFSTLRKVFYRAAILKFESSNLIFTSFQFIAINFAASTGAEIANDKKKTVPR